MIPQKKQPPAKYKYIHVAEHLYDNTIEFQTTWDF